VFLAEPPRTQYDLNFEIAGIPVRIHPLFWLVGVILGAGGGSGVDGAGIVIWVGVLFISILVHELGHAFTMRRFGERPRVVLYMMGGLAIADSGWGMGKSSRNSFEQIVISAAGPAAGFALAGLVIALVYAGGGAVVFDVSHSYIQIWQIQLERGMPWYESINDDNRYLFEVIHGMLYVNIFWGLVNLLPIYPLDGGQISRELFAQGDPWEGVRKSLWLSFVTGAIVAVMALMFLQSILMAVMFGALAYSSWQALQQIGGGGGFGGGGFGGGGGPWGGGRRPW